VTLKAFRQGGFVVDGVGFTENTAKSIAEAIVVGA